MKLRCRVERLERLQARAHTVPGRSCSFCSTRDVNDAVRLLREGHERCPACGERWVLAVLLALSGRL